MALKNNVCSRSVFSFPAWGTCQRWKVKMAAASSSADGQRGRSITQTFGHTHKKWTSWRCVDFESFHVCHYFLLLSRSLPLQLGSVQLSVERLRVRLPRLPWMFFTIRTRTFTRSASQSATATTLCTVCSARGKKQERGRSSSPLPAPLAAAAVAAQDTKFKSPCTDTQGLSQCDWGIAKLTSGDVARLFGILFVCLFIFALQPIDNKQPSYHYLVATVGKSSLSGVWKRR